MSVRRAARSAAWVVVVVVVVVVVGVLSLTSGCSGDGQPGATARTEAPTADDFCSALVDLRADFANADLSDPTGYVASVKAAAERLSVVGTPTKMPASAQDGLHLTLQRIAALPHAASSDDLDALNRADRQQRTQLRALADYVEANCPAS